MFLLRKIRKDKMNNKELKNELPLFNTLFTPRVLLFFLSFFLLLFCLLDLNAYQSKYYLSTAILNSAIIVQNPLLRHIYTKRMFRVGGCICISNKLQLKKLNSFAGEYMESSNYGPKIHVLYCWNGKNIEIGGCWTVLKQKQ